MLFIYSLYGTGEVRVAGEQVSWTFAADEISEIAWVNLNNLRYI